MPARYRGNPAIDFLKRPHAGRPEQLIQDYATFLLHTADAYRLPVPLERVHRYFGFPVRRRRLPEDQQGFTTGNLDIYLNADDWPTRQKFTLAHELMEVFFFALKDEGTDPSWMDDTCFVTLCDNKERYCNRGAAELVMPLPLFRDLAGEQPISLQWARQLAKRCGVSLKATLCRLIETGLAPVVLITWRYKNSPIELARQKSKWGNVRAQVMLPPKKMRVEEVSSPPGSPFIPRDKSVSEDSSIHQAFSTGRPTTAIEELHLVGIDGHYRVESRPFTVAGERRVMSLIHLDNES